LKQKQKSTLTSPPWPLFSRPTGKVRRRFPVKKRRRIVLVLKTAAANPEWRAFFFAFLFDIYWSGI